MNNENIDSVSSETNQIHFSCDTCNKNFFTEFQYKVHSVTHLIPEHFDGCCECLEGTAHILNLDKHLETHNNLTCKDSLHGHGEKHNGESTTIVISERGTSDEKIQSNIFSCDRCKKEFPEKNSLEEHYGNTCIKKELNTDETNDLISTVFHASDDENATSSKVLNQLKNVKVLTKVHITKSPKIAQFVCEMCQKVFSNKCSLIVHSSTHCIQKTFKCRTCEKKFALKSLLSAHLRTHKTKRVFCGVCQKGFASKEKLFNHVYVHALVESFSCNICQMKFSEKSSLEKHGLKHIAERRMQNIFRCDKCGKEFSEKDRFQEHYRSHSIKKELNSDEDEDFVPSSVYPAQEISTERALLNKRKRTPSRKFFEDDFISVDYITLKEEKESEKDLTCEVCGKKFFSKKTLTDHQYIHSGEFPHACDVCSKGFARLEHLKRHYNVHFKEYQPELHSKKALNGHKSTNSTSLSYVCGVCSRGFARRDHLKRHYAVHSKEPQKKLSSEPSYFCDACSEGFTTPDQLKQHYQTHSRQKPYKCETCGTSFQYKANLISHQQGHQSKGSKKLASSDSSTRCANVKIKSIKHESRRHVCEVCSKVFARADHLRRHHLIHTGEKPFRCETCGSRFNQKSTLTAHQLKHLPKESGMQKSPGSGSFKCKTCGKMFVKEILLKKHIRVHLAEKPFECDYCDQKFTMRKNMLRHVRRIHERKS